MVGSSASPETTSFLLQRIISLTHFIITVNVVNVVEISKHCMKQVVFYFVLIFHLCWLVVLKDIALYLPFTESILSNHNK
jgi:hypothetical protein